MARKQIDKSQFKADPSQTIPKTVLRAAGLLVVTALALTTAARVSGMTPYASPPPSTPVASRTIVMTPVKPGGVVVSDHRTGEIIATLVEEGGGFVGGVERALARVRKTEHQPAAGPVELTRWENGRLSLHDPSTDWKVELIGFGDDNFRAFARLLQDGAAPARMTEARPASEPKGGSR